MLHTTTHKPPFTAANSSCGNRHATRLLLQPLTRRTSRAALFLRHATPPQQQQTQTQSDAAESDPAYAYSDGVNKFLGNFLPSSSSARQELSVDFDAPKLTGISLDELGKLVEQGLLATQVLTRSCLPACLHHQQREQPR